jgi:hypothetical protein
LTTTGITSAGTHVIVATYNGDTRFLTSNDNLNQVIV